MKKFAHALAFALAASSAAAGPSDSAYKLNLEQPGAFRLAAAAAIAKAAPAEPKKFSGKPFARQIQKASDDAGVDPALVHALVFVESRYDPAARSPKGALGLMQLMPATASRYGEANPLRSPEANLRAGTRYLKDLLQMFDQRLELALAAYNAGENAVLRYGSRIPPYSETRAYVPAVLAKYREWREPLRPAAPPGRVRVQYLPGTLRAPD
jgi:soluble lytic murein transglycosylase-like protein